MQTSYPIHTLATVTVTDVHQHAEISFSNEFQWFLSLHYMQVDAASLYLNDNSRNFKQNQIMFPVSYTHLDVYKRQALCSARLTINT